MKACLRKIVCFSLVSVCSAALAAEPKAAGTHGPGESANSTDQYVGQFCEGQGDVEFLRLIDESFAFFHPNPVVPNLAMLYQPDWDTFEEGAGWGAWWIQNSYGFSYAATPFLQEPWFSTLQRSWDLFWDRQGDGKRVGRPDFPLVAPDGCLGDCASPAGIVYRQGDGNWHIHDWFHEATAAGVVMQAEILLASRDRAAMARYLPKMQRACDSVERTRDPRNQLFLVGPACNLLAPSYGGVKQADGSFGKGYLAGLSITYLAALDRMVELYKLGGDREHLAEYQRRQRITRQSLAQLLTPAGYFVKSLEPGGIKHGVLGQRQFGYLEGVANADAVALRVVDDATAASIYRQIAASGHPRSGSAIRPFDFLLTNAPGLDDTYVAWGRADGLGGFFNYGDWVNGGVWGTVEGRAILMYYRLGRFEDVRRSATRAMKWAKDFRMDAPWSQRGENASNPWSDGGQFKIGGVAVMIDNFAIPAATIRGLFDYEYRADGLVLRPRVPACIARYVQKEPVRFGQKTLYLSCRNGGPKIKSVAINGKAVKLATPDAVTLAYDDLPAKARVEIVTDGGWPAETAMAARERAPYPVAPPLVTENSRSAPAPSALPESLKSPFAVLSAMDKSLTSEPGADFERAWVAVAIESCKACQARAALDPGPGYYRPITAERKAGIEKFYERAALAVYRGFSKRMADYGVKGDQRQKHIAALFAKAQTENNR